MRGMWHQGLTIVIRVRGFGGRVAGVRLAEEAWGQRQGAGLELGPVARLGPETGSKAGESSKVEASNREQG